MGCVWTRDTNNTSVVCKHAWLCKNAHANTLSAWTHRCSHVHMQGQNKALSSCHSLRIVSKAFAGNLGIWLCLDPSIFLSLLPSAVSALHPYRQWWETGGTMEPRQVLQVQCCHCRKAEGSGIIMGALSNCLPTHLQIFSEMLTDQHF